MNMNEADQPCHSDRPHHVMLSAAKHLGTRRVRCFAEFTLERSEGLSMTDPRLTLRRQHIADLDW